MVKDIELLNKILQMSQSELFDYLKVELKQYYTYIDSDGMSNKYIYCRGKLGVLVMAHLDTVYDIDEKYIPLDKELMTLFDEPVSLQDYEDFYGFDDEPNIASIDISPKDIFYDSIKEVMWSPDGLGADDRAGVYMILQLLKDGLRPHVLFTTDEEIGGVGAERFAIKYRSVLRATNIKYIMELDRSGSNDCVFYDCDNKRFEKFINKFGFCTESGTFSDISIVCPITGIAGVNLSVGYYYEHTTTEMLDVFTMGKIYDIIYNMIKHSNSIESRFKYIRGRKKLKGAISFNTEIKCAICDSLSKEYYKIDGFGYVCKDCYTIATR